MIWYKLFNSDCGNKKNKKTFTFKPQNPQVIWQQFVLIWSNLAQGK